MVINNFYIERIAISPDEADPILVINANAVLAFTITLQSLKTISWKDCQISQLVSCMQL